MKRPPQHNNHWSRGKVRFNHPPLEDTFGPVDGIFPMKAILSPDLGEEIILYWRDQTNFMEELRLIHPFRLFLKAGVTRNEFGPLAFLLFGVENPSCPSEYCSAIEMYVNPFSEEQIAVLRKLASQTHWHLFLIGQGSQQRGFYEFGNVYQMHEILDLVQEACGPVQMVDFLRAKELFMQEHTVDDLFRLESTPGIELPTPPPATPKVASTPPPMTQKLTTPPVVPKPESPPVVSKPMPQAPPTPKPIPPPTAPTPPDAFFLDHLNQWLVVTVNSTFPNAPGIHPWGTHAAAYLYNDHEAGISIRVTSFLVFSSDRYPRSTRDIMRDDGRRLIIRNETLQRLEVRPMSQPEHGALELPSRPEDMHFYEHPDYATFRKQAWLAPFRAPWYPDDVKFLVPPPAKLLQGFPKEMASKFRGDMVWGRVERLRPDGHLECTMLNDLDGGHELQAGVRVLVACYERDGKRGLFYTGRAT